MGRDIALVALMERYLNREPNKHLYKRALFKCLIIV